jgi:hypothetical protein
MKQYHITEKSSPILVLTNCHIYQNSQNYSKLSNFHTRGRGYDYGYDRPGDYDYNDRDDYPRGRGGNRPRPPAQARYARPPPPRRPPSKAYKRPPPKKHSSDSGGSFVGVVFRIVAIIFILAFFLMPQFEPYRNTFIDYLMAGLYKYEEIPDTVDFSVEREFSITSDGYLNYTLFIPIPQDIEIEGRDAQILKEYEMEPRFTDRTGGQGEHWIWHDILETGGQATINIVYHFRTTKISWDISIGKSGIINDIKGQSPGYMERYTGDAWPVADYQDPSNIDTDNDGLPDDRDVDDDGDGIAEKYRIEPSTNEIRTLLKTILVDNNLIDQQTSISNIGHLNVYQVVKAIYDFIDDTCTYPTIEQQYHDSQTYGGYPKWATGTYTDERGDCDDQSILFISLCRAAGIPAMLEIGALYDPQLDNWEGHGWANVYIPYKEEYQAEKGSHVTPMVDIVNDIFLFRDPNRFSEWVDDGVKGKFNATGVWQPSHLELRYLAWEYFYEGSYVDTEETYTTLEFDASPPDKLYI